MPQTTRLFPPKYTQKIGLAHSSRGFKSSTKQTANPPDIGTHSQHSPHAQDLQLSHPTHPNVTHNTTHIHQTDKLFSLYQNNTAKKSFISPNYSLYPWSIPFLTSFSITTLSAVIIGLDVAKNSLAEQIATINQQQWDDNPDFLALTVGSETVAPKNEVDIEADGDDSQFDRHFDEKGHELTGVSLMISKLKSILKETSQFFLQKMIYLPQTYIRSLILFSSRLSRTLILFIHFVPPLFLLSAISFIDLMFYFVYTRTQPATNLNNTPHTSPQPPLLTEHDPLVPQIIAGYQSPPFVASLYNTWWGLFKTTLQTSGATVTKLGQYLSCRPDILSPEICAILADLQSNNETHPWESTNEMFTMEFGPRWEEFLYVSPQDVCGSGCIAQVYRGMFNLTRYIEIQIELQDMADAEDCKTKRLLLSSSGKHRHGGNDADADDDDNDDGDPMKLNKTSQKTINTNNIMVNNRLISIPPVVRSWLSDDVIAAIVHSIESKQNNNIDHHDINMHNQLDDNSQFHKNNDLDDNEVEFNSFNPSFDIEKTKEFLQTESHDYLSDSLKLTQSPALENSQTNDKILTKIKKRILKSQKTSEIYHKQLKLHPNDTILTVAIKVLHPDSVYSINRDLNILTTLVRLAESLPYAKLQFASPVQLCAEFSRLMRTQLNMHQEALNLRRFNSTFQNESSLLEHPSVPQISTDQPTNRPSLYKDFNVSPAFPIPLLSSPSVLIETYHSGILMTDFLMMDKIPATTAKVLSQTGYIDTLYQLCTVYHQHQNEIRSGKNKPVDAANFLPNGGKHEEVDSGYVSELKNVQLSSASPIKLNSTAPVFDINSTLPPTLHDLRSLQQRQILSHFSPNQLDWIRKQYAEIGLHTFLTMCFQHGFFHSDLHSGNMIIDLGYDIMDPITLQSLLDLLSAINTPADVGANANKSPTTQTNSTQLPVLPQSINNHNNHNNHTNPSFLPDIPHYQRILKSLAQSVPIQTLTNQIALFSNKIEYASTQCDVLSSIKSYAKDFHQRQQSIERMNAIKLFFENKAWDPGSIFPHGIFTLLHSADISIYPSYDDSTDDLYYKSHFYQKRIPQPAHKPKLVMIDAGMSTALTKRDKTNFNDLFYAIAMGRGYEAAAMMIERAQPIFSQSTTNQQVGKFYGDVAMNQLEFLNRFEKELESSKKLEQLTNERANQIEKIGLYLEKFAKKCKIEMEEVCKDVINEFLHSNSKSGEQENVKNMNIFGTSIIKPYNILSPQYWSTIRPLSSVYKENEQYIDELMSFLDQNVYDSSLPLANNNPSTPQLIPYQLPSGDYVLVHTQGGLSQEPTSQFTPLTDPSRSTLDLNSSSIGTTSTPLSSVSTINEAEITPKPLETLHIKDDVYINLNTIPYNPFQTRENRQAFIKHVGDLILDVRARNFQLDSVGVVSILTSLIGASREFCIKLDTSFISLVIAVIVFEGVGRQLDSKLDIISPSLSIIIKTQLQELSTVANAKIDEANQLLDQTIEKTNQKANKLIDQTNQKATQLIDETNQLLDEAIEFSSVRSNHEVISKDHV